MPSVSSTRYSLSREPTQASPIIHRSVVGQSSETMCPPTTLILRERELVQGLRQGAAHPGGQPDRGDVARTRLAPVEGLAAVWLVGGQQREVRVHLDPVRLAAAVAPPP